MRSFICHNSKDKETARILASSLVEQGIDVWLDEWALAPGDSIVGGIEEGVSACDLFVLLWSTNAEASAWVGTELRAAIRRRVDDRSLRVVPVMLDDTPLPALVADYRGYRLRSMSDLATVSRDIAGRVDTFETAQRLQRRLLEMVANEFPPEDAIRALVCPRCASSRLSAYGRSDSSTGEKIFYVVCEDCGLENGTVPDI